MIINSKQNCISDLSASVKRTAIWRRGLEAKFNDSRNGLAAERLDQLAIEIANLSDQDWSELSVYYSWSSGKWADAVSQTSRQVGFRRVNTLPDFVSSLVGILSGQHVTN
jgi:hypothetical protein